MKLNATCIRFVCDVAVVALCMWAGVFSCRMIAFLVAWWRGVDAGTDGFISGAGIGAWLVWKAFKRDIPNTNN